MTDTRDRELELFAAACERPPGERRGFLEAACAADPDLRNRIVSLIAAIESGDRVGFLAPDLGDGSA